ncbi:MAG: UDP-2,3-diacylglucosamine diphosphatase [Flavobacteriales bacterium]|nr:UDP-2,3-diacylglucosamine diphosphatase [Flavobacteriales bacterium]
MHIHKRRPLDVLVLSDIHLGTYGCRATELLNYLKTVEPKVLVLNGDIIDIWQFSKRYFPGSHMKILKYITSLLARDTKVYYVTGNHDEMLRKFEGFRIGTLEITNKLLLELDGQKAWIFHGDVFDVTMKHSKWLAKLGGHGYDALILLNTFVNWVSVKLGRGRISLSKRVKNSVKSAIKHISDFEETAISIALSNRYDYVICGHIHQPCDRVVRGDEGNSVRYLNSGDWVENLTALEYADGNWSIYEYFKDPIAKREMDSANLSDPELSKMEFRNKDLLNALLAEFSEMQREPLKSSL